MVSASIQQHQQAADKFGDMLEAYTDGMIVVNENAEILLINTQAERLFGYTDLELFGKTVETVIPAYFFIEHAGRRTHFAKTPKTTASKKGMEPFGVKKDGTKIPIDISLSPVVTVGGTLIFASVTDMTDRKIEAKKLQRSQEDFQLLVNSVKEYAIFMLDTDGNVVTWNSGAERIKGYRADEITGKNIEVFYTPEEIQKGIPKQNLEIALRQGHFESEGFRVRKDGSVFYANVVFTPLYDDHNELYGYAKVTRDITEKQNTEESLRYMATIADSIQDPIISSDNNSFITRWNDAAEKLLEWKSEEVLGKNIDSVLSVYYPGETKTEILISLQQKGRWQGELVYRTKSRKPVSVLVTESQLKNNSSVVKGSIVVAKDITKRKKKEEALTKANRDLEGRLQERTEAFHQNQVLFEAMLQYSNEIFLRADENLAIIFCSLSAERILGWTAEEMGREKLPAKVHPDDKSALENELYHSMAHPGRLLPLLFRHLHKNGAYHWLEGTVINSIPDKYIQSLVVCLHDVTQLSANPNRLSDAPYPVPTSQDWEDHSSA